MSLRRYRTNWGIWLIAAFAIFIGIGFGTRFDIKEERYSLVGLIFANISELFSDNDYVAALVSIPIVLLICGVPALVVGWVLQSLAVIAISRYGRSKPSA